MVRVGIVGATGYTGLELIKLLLRHPEVEIVALTSRQEDRPHIADVHPQLKNRLDLHLEPLLAQDVASRCDCVFSCLPHAASAETVNELLSYDVRVVDFSADYRLNDVKQYEAWYDTQHPDPARVPTTPYGLAECFRDAIVDAQLVANPGCYPTSAILPLAPLLTAGVVSSTDLIIDSKSGVSGAGRTPKLATHFPECNENFSAYGVGTHRHTPEIKEVLSTIAGVEVDLIFTPHLVPMDRGILSTIYAQRTGNHSADELIEIIAQAYDSRPFIRASDSLPNTKNVAHTNCCDIGLRVVGDRVVIVSAIDNLVKGASGAAVQNLNLMFGLPESMGLN